MEELIIPGLPDEVSRECLARIPPQKLPSARHVSRLWRAEVESPPFHSLRRASGLSRPVVALAQIDRPGKPISFSLSLLDPVSGQWAAPPPVPGGRLPIFCHVTAAGRQLFVLGGWNPATWIATNELFIFDLVSYAWRRGATIPGPRRSFFACAAAPDGRHVYIAGGHDEEKNSLRSAFVYDVAHDEWTELPDMAAERDECSGMFVNDKFCVAGGYSTESQGRFAWSAEVFDPAAWRWETTTAEEAEGETAAAVVAGGDGRLYRCAEGHVEVLEGKGMMWRKLAELPECGDGKKAIAPRLVVLNGAHEKLMMFASARPGKCSTMIFTMELGREDLRPTWVPAPPPPERISGLVQAACCLEI